MCEVGCALSVCRPEQIYSIDTKGDAGADGQGSQILDKVFMLVCVYGAGAGEDTPHAQLPNLCCKIIVAS